LVYAKQFAEELYDLAEANNHLFYKGIANYIIGYIGLKEGDNSNLQNNLKKIEEAAVYFIEVNDYAGAGMCFNRIGTIYEKQVKNVASACLFYREAIENYNKAILYTHPLRVTPWSKPEILIEKIIELRDLIDVIVADIEEIDIKDKIIKDLKSIHYNF
jgi:tetratricopeptide (TPR) repeat protein